MAALNNGSAKQLKCQILHKNLQLYSDMKNKNSEKQPCSCSPSKTLWIAITAILSAACPLRVETAKPSPKTNMFNTNMCNISLVGSAGVDEETWKLCQKEAEEGQAEAQAVLGMLYLEKSQNDKETEQNISTAKAVQWMKKAANQGQVEAQLLLGILYAQGEAVAVKDIEMGFMWLQKAAEQGNADAQEEVANVVLYRAATEATPSTKSKRCRRTTMDEDTLEMREKCQQAAAKGEVGAQYYVGWMYYVGYGVAEDAAQALQWFKKAAEQGNPTAQYYVAYMYLRGEGLGPETDNEYALAIRTEEAVKWLTLSAQQGDAYAQFHLGGLYKNGEGVVEDKAEATRWLRLAAEQGLPSAQYTLGNMYSTELSSFYSEEERAGRDEAEAAKWYKKAAEQGHVYAKEALSRMRLDVD
ncbi:MAG: sel1 repeat family protein [Cystobacterineae bacterium]|nr:sel1 repeat family protein [Cystobacterineae bacterium]